MPLQLFGRDDIIVSYEDENRGNTPHRWSESRHGIVGRVRNWISSRMQGLTDRKFCGIGIVHWLMLFVWSALLVRFMGIYSWAYAKSALLTTIMTNALLFGTSDILAQSIACCMSGKVDPIPEVIDATSRDITARFSALRNDDHLDIEGDDENMSIFDDYGPLHTPRLFTRFNSPATLVEAAEEDEASALEGKFDFYRWLCFMSWGSFLALFQLPWYKFLNFFYTEDPTVVQVLERVLSDQLVYSPISLYCFLMYSSYIMEKGDLNAFHRKIANLYLSTLGCNFLVWFPVQFINFSVVPRHYQVPFSSSVGVLWNCFLSMRNSYHSV
ncbi:LAMI_0A03576g1_1 [Lachancea mirantina]|uniref:LAMI_0A03576g1_1 n=1 Tax=Lachancea mirantina TaxID=1230905 RepID=A0A1G4IN94_9SACH|nr:LAMI_0A03576g1_1 [Lachancea mirantina]